MTPIVPSDTQPTTLKVVSVKLEVPRHIDPRDTSIAARADRFALAYHSALLNPKGFRQPSLRRGTSLVMKRSQEAGVIGDAPHVSERSKRRRVLRALHVERVREQTFREAAAFASINSTHG